MKASRYQKQMKWKIESEKNALELKKIKDKEEIEKCTFTPIIHTNKDNNNTNNNNSNTNSNNNNASQYVSNADIHIRRQQQARSNKKNTEDRLVYMIKCMYCVYSVCVYKCVYVYGYIYIYISSIC